MVAHIQRMYTKYLSNHRPTEYLARILPAEEEIMVALSDEDEDNVQSNSNYENEACHIW